MMSLSLGLISKDRPGEDGVGHFGFPDVGPEVTQYDLAPPTNHCDRASEPKCTL